ncbi:MAG: hypothetical protein JW852_09830, partial [Spirochaetales bacterium]|nr:hypothetical protein [Spirochaetales bacterium]
MADKKDVLALLRAFALRRKNQVIGFADFVTFSQKYSEQKKADIPSLATLTSDTEIQLSTHLEDLAEAKKCTLIYDQGRIGSVVYPEFFSELVKVKYKEIADDPEIPFPNQNTIDLKIPADNVQSVDIKSDFVRLLGAGGEEESNLLQFMFPEGINPIIVPSDLIENTLLALCVEKIRLYLNTQRNAFYMLSKLRGVFRAKEQGLKDMINSVVSGRSQALETIHNPTEFSFMFWTHLANAIIREYREKTNKLEREHTYCQAAYMLGFYNVYFKGRVQKKKDSEAALKMLDRRMRQAPYYFTVSDIGNFRDNQGLPLTRNYSSEQMHLYLETKTKPADSASLPEIFRLKASDRKEYYVAKEVLLPLTVKKIHDASNEYRKVYTNEWAKQLEAIKKTQEMKSDEDFVRGLDARVKSEDPLLSALLSYEMLFLTLQDSKPHYDVHQEISRILNTNANKLIPMDDILRLNRREIFAQAKMSLPLWKTMPVINRLFGFLKKFLSGAQLRQGKKTKKKKPTTEKTASAGTKLLGAEGEPPRSRPAQVEAISSGEQPATAHARALALKKAMASLKIQFVGNASLEDTMEELIEKWNPLFDPQAKANLVEDVNALVRDFLRKL